jgi:hypothetical protein
VKLEVIRVRCYGSDRKTVLAHLTSLSDSSSSRNSGTWTSISRGRVGCRCVCGRRSRSSTAISSAMLTPTEKLLKEKESK